MRGGLKGAKTPPYTKLNTSKIFGLIVLGKFESTGTLLDVEQATRCAARGQFPALLVIRVLTDAESESAGGNSEAKSEE